MSRKLELPLLLLSAMLAACGGGSDDGGGGTTTYTLTVTKSGAGTGTVAGTGISCGVDCTETVAAGTTVTLTATPDGGSTFGGWSGGGCAGTGSCTVTVSAATSVDARFDAAAATWPLTVTRSGTGTGTVAGTGISCGVDCTETVAAGTTVTLTATPDGGSTFGGWSGGGCSGTGSCTVTVSAATSVDARFDVAATTRRLTVTVSGGSSTLVTSTPGGISCYGGTCQGDFASGTSVALTATSPMSDSAFVSWGGDCAGGDPGTCSVTLDVDRTVTATFATLRTLSVSATGNGGVTSDVGGIACGTAGAACTAGVADGTTVTLTASPGAGQSTQWGGDCSGATGLTCTLTLSVDRWVTATFTPVWTLDVALAGAGAGTVTSSPSGITCGADCGEPFADGTTVWLTAAPSAGSVFTGWTGDCAAAGTSTTCMLTMSANRTVGAGFALVRTLTVTVGTGGHVTSAPTGIDCWGGGGGTCSFDFVDGTPVTLTAVEPSGYQLTGWTGCDTSTGLTCEVAMTSARTVDAAYTPVRTLNVQLWGAGSLVSTPAGIDCTGVEGLWTYCSHSWLDGQSVTLTATPDPGWAISWWLDGGCTGTGTTCDVTLTANTTVQLGLEGPFDFQVAIPFNSAFQFSMLPGEARSFPVAVSTARGSGLPVTLSATGLPAGVTASFDPPAPTPPATSTLTLSADAAVPIGNTLFTITGVNGAVTHGVDATLQVRSPMGLGELPYGVAIEPGGATALVTEQNYGWDVGRITRIDLATRLAVRTVAAGIPDQQTGTSDLRPARDLAVEGSGETLLVVDRAGLARITTATGAIARITTTPALYEPHGLALVDASTALVTDCGDASCSNGRLLRVDLSTGAAAPLTPAISGIGDPRGVAVEAGGSTALLVEKNAPGRLLRVPLSGGSVTAVATALTGPTGLAIEAGGETALVSGGNGIVSRVVLATGTATPVMNVQSSEAPGIAIEAGGATALVVQDRPSRLTRLHLTSPLLFDAPGLQSFDALFRPSGIALTSPTTALVTDCGPGNDCSAYGRVVEVDLLAGSVGRTVVGGLDDPRSISIEAGGATALVALAGTGQVVRVDLVSVPGAILDTWNLYSPYGVRGVAAAGAVAYVTGQDGVNSPFGAVIVEVDLTTGVRTLVGSQLGAFCEARGIALEAGTPPTTALVVRTCSGTADLLRVPLDGSAVTTIASGLPPLVGVAIEAGGMTALVTEGSDSWDTGRVLRVELATGLTYELAAPLLAPRDLSLLTTGDAAVTALDGLWLSAGAPAFAPRIAVRGIDRPTGFAFEPGEATAALLACPGSDCTVGGRLERVTLATGARAAIATTLNTPKGVVYEAPNQLLVTDCGALPNDCGSKGRVVRYTGGTPTLIASALNDPMLLAMEADGTHALLAERGQGRILRVDLVARSYTPIAAGLASPTQVVPESGGASALLVQGGTYPGLYRLDLATGAVSEVAVLYEVGGGAEGRFAIEPGGTTALVLGSQWPSMRRSLVRVNLASGGLDVLVPGILESPQATAFSSTTGLWYTEQSVASPTSYPGAIVNLAIP